MLFILYRASTVEVHGENRKYNFIAYVTLSNIYEYSMTSFLVVKFLVDNPVTAVMPVNPRSTLGYHAYAIYDSKNVRFRLITCDMFLILLQM